MITKSFHDIHDLVEFVGMLKDASITINFEDGMTRFSITNASDGEECDFVFAAVEKDPPYLINVIQCDELLIKHGYDLYREYFGMYKECSESGNWYGYNGAFGIINNMGLPAWLASQYEN